MMPKTRKLYEFKPMLGPYDEWPPGSVEWAERVSAALQVHSRHVDTTSKHYFPKTIKAIIETQPPPWEVFPKDNPFGSPDIYCQAVTGHSWEALLTLASELDPEDKRKLQKALAEAQAKNRPQGSRTDLLRSNTTKLDDRGSQYLLRRLARYDKETGSDFLTRFEQGEYRSVRAAAIEAGIVKVPTSLELLQKAWAKATEAERAAFRATICNHP